jgi:Uncharacterized membrane protein, putative virulence factor
MAFRLPNLLRDLFAEGALSTAFITTFSKKDRGRRRSIGVAPGEQGRHAHGRVHERDHVAGIVSRRSWWIC